MLMEKNIKFNFSAKNFVLTGGGKGMGFATLKNFMILEQMLL